MPADFFEKAAEEEEEGEENEPGADLDNEDPAEEQRDSVKDDGQDEDDEHPNESPEDKDSSEEEADDDNEYDLTDKFIAREDEEEEDGDVSEGERERKRRHKRRRERSPELDEEDYQLLEDNQVTGIRRQKKSERKRIRKQPDNQNKTDAQRLQEELFGTAEEAGLEDDVQEEALPTPLEDEFDESDDEMAGFIDDDDPGRRAGRRRAKGLPRGVSSHGLQEMQDIFGDVDELLELYTERKAAAVLGRDESAEDLAAPEDEDDEEALAAYQQQLEQKKQQRQQQKMEAAIEPELMERLMMLPLDDRIREADAPERFQLSGEADLAGAFTESQIHDAARWILDQLIGPIPQDAAENAKPGEDDGVTRKREACSVLEDGILEVDGNPRDGRHTDAYDYNELAGHLTDLSRGLRGLRRKRKDAEVVLWRRDRAARHRLVKAIVSVLKEMWNQRHEIPLIACFRKELCGELLSLREGDAPGTTTEEDVERRRRHNRPEFPEGAVQAKHRRLRRWDALWAVHDLSAKWRAMVKRRERRMEAFRLAQARCEVLVQQQEGGEPDLQLEELQQAIQSCIAEAAEADSMEELDDIDTKFKLVTAGHPVVMLDDLGPGTRRPQRSSAYSLLKQAGLDEVVSAMAMSAADFGDNLLRSLKLKQPQDSRTMPMDLAYGLVRHKDPAFDKPEKILDRARQIHVAGIVAEPNVRAFIRSHIHAHMRISTAPTATGESQLDIFHVLGPVKRLQNKPALAFNGTDGFLRVMLAEKEGLITIANEVDNMEQLFVQPMLEYYESSAVSAVSREWNELRQKILRDAVQRLVPQLQQEASSRLLTDARDAVVEQYAERLWKYASQPPVQMKSEEGDVVVRRRLAACCWGEGRPATCMVMLDDQGSLVDVLFLPSFSGQLRAVRQAMGTYNIAEDPRKAADVRKVVEFCRDNRPQAIFVGARNLFCKVLKEDMGRIGDFILDAHAAILTSGHDTGSIEVCYAEEVLADLWANSTAGKEEFPDHPEVVRRAVALGRLALEPLAVLASLCRPDGKEILSLNLHPLQSHVPQTDLMKAAETTLITAANQVGADINLMASNTWQASTLSFIAGLGPRKAQSLLQAVQKKEFALNRFSIWNEIWKPGNTVFRNCGAFLRITANARGLVNAEVEAIDGACIEPLSYRLAYEVAREAVGGPGSADSEEDKEQDAANVTDAMASPEKVEALNLEHLHERLAAESSNPENYNQISTLVDIAMEFVLPNHELRSGSIMEESQKKERQFWWMVGETEETLKAGRRVELMVVYVGQNEARCVLPELGGLEALLQAKDISSSQQNAVPGDYLKAGQSVTARIKSVRPEDFVVDVTTASTDLNDDRFWEEKYTGGDRYYHVLTHEERRASEAEKKRQARKQLTKRTIDHPNFRNASMIEAVALLEGLAVGEAIFRPSSQGVNHISLSMKLHQGPEGALIFHRDVAEGRKRGGALTLGTPLRLVTGSNDKQLEEFEDLDEILARYAEPLADKVQAIVSHRKFREGSWDEIKDELHREASSMRGGQAFYCLGVDYMHPGLFYIGKVLPTANKTPRREHFSVMPSGYHFRQQDLTSVEKMLAVFKRNPMGKPPPAPADLGAPPMQPAPMQPFAYAPQQQAYYPQSGGGFGGVNMYEPQPQPQPPQQYYTQTQPATYHQ